MLIPNRSELYHNISEIKNEFDHQDVGYSYIFDNTRSDTSFKNQRYNITYPLGQIIYQNNFENNDFENLNINLEAEYIDFVNKI